MRDAHKYNWSPQDAPRRRVFWWGWAIPAVFVVLAIYLLTGCASNPVAAGTTPDQKAYALYGEFVVFEEAAAALRKNGTLTGAPLKTVQDADARAKPTADALLKAVIDFETVSAQVKAGATTADKLTIASANVQTWIATATTDVNALATAVKGAKAP